MTDTLAGSLQGSFSANGGFHLDVTVSGVGGLLQGINPALPTLDVSAINTAIELLKGVDFSAIADAVDDAAANADGVLDELPDPGSLLDGLATALTKLIGGVEADIGHALAEIESGARRLAELLRDEAAVATDLDVSIGAARLAAFLELLAQAAGNPLVGLVIAGFANIGGHLIGGWSAISREGAGWLALAQSIGSLGGIDELSRQALTLAKLLDQRIDVAQLEALIERLANAAANADLAAALAAVDPNDAAAVERALAPILAFAADIEQLAELVDGALSAATNALARLDLPGLVAGLEKHGAQLLDAGLKGVGELAVTLRGILDPALRVQPPKLTGEKAAAYLSRRMEQAAKDLAKADVAKTFAPLTKGIGATLGPLHEFRVTAERVSAAIEKAIRAFAAAAGRVDLGVAARTLRQALRPVADALATISHEIEDLQHKMDQVAGGLKDDIDKARTDIEALFAGIHDAFQRLGDHIGSAQLDAIVAELRAGVEQVAGVLRAAPLQPFIDETVKILSTAADVLSAVPKDLLPAAVREELDVACAAIEEIDFQAVTDELAGDLKDIVDGVEGDVLSELDDLHAELVAFVGSIDPRGKLADLETAVKPVVERLRAFDATTLLAPVEEALNEVRAAIKTFDPDELVAPIETAFDKIADGFKELDPAKLLGELAKDATALRAQIQEALPIGDAVATLTKVDTWIASHLGKIDRDTLLAVLDSIYDGLVLAIRELACETGQLAGSLRAMLKGVDLDVAVGSLQAGLKWVFDSSAATTLSGRIDGLLDSLDTASHLIDASALDALTVDLTRTHKAIAAALPPAGPLHDELAPVLARVDPTGLLAGLTGQLARHAHAIDDALAALRSFKGSSWSQLTVATQALRVELRPLDAVLERLRVWLDWLGADVAHDGLVKSVNALLAQLRPSLIMGKLADALHDLGKDIADVIHRGVLAPIVTALGDVEGLIKLIAVPVPPELVALHAKLAGQIDQLRPKVVLADTLTAVRQTLHTLVEFDPLKAVKEVIADVQKAIVRLLEEAHPSVLFAPVLDVFDRVVHTIEQLDIRALLQPVLDALDDLDGQLAAGLDEAGVTLDRLKDACKSPGGLSVGVTVAS